MKNIELTENHKSKLLEMCKELFPEYVIYPADNDGFIEGEQWVGDQNMGEDRPVNEFNIHWFEFCTKIGHKIFSRKQFYYQSEEFITFMKIMCLQDKSKLKHPIDYLYEEFKKLK